MNTARFGCAAWFGRAVALILSCAFGVLLVSAAAAGAATSAQISTYVGSDAPGPVPALSVGMEPNRIEVASGNLFISEPAHSLVREVSGHGTQTVTAGNGSYLSFNPDGRPATSGGLTPGAMAIDSQGDQLIPDQSGGRIRLVAGASCSSSCSFGLPSTTKGDIYTIAGGGTSLGDGGPATAAQLSAPTGVAIDAKGDVLIADQLNLRVRLIAASACSSKCAFGLAKTTVGYIYTIAGDGNYGDGGNGGPGTSADLTYPGSVAVNARGDVFISETGTNHVRMVAASPCPSSCPLGFHSLTAGYIYALAGDGTAGFSGDGGAAASAELSNPQGVKSDAKGDVLIADSNNGRVRLVAASTCSSGCPFGLASTTAGDIYTVSGDGRGVPIYPTDTAVDAHGDLLIDDNGTNTVRMLAEYACSSACAFGLPSTTPGQMYIVAGNGSPSYSGDGGPGLSAQLGGPHDVFADPKGNLLITDALDNRVRMEAKSSCSSSCAYGLSSTVAGHIYTVAGNGNIGYSGDGVPATSAAVWEPNSVAVDAKGDLLIADTWGSRVRLVAAASCTSACPYGLPSTTRGDIYTLAGNSNSGFAGDGGPAKSATLGQPAGIAVDANGDVIISDTFNSRVRLIATASCASSCPYGLAKTTANDIYTIAGGGTAGKGDGGPGPSAQLEYPSGVTVDARGDALIADGGNQGIRLLAGASCTSGCPFSLPATTKGHIYTVAGGGNGGTADGVAATTATISLAYTLTPGLTVDTKGDLVLSDGGDGLVRMVAAASCTSACPFGLAKTTKGDIYTVAGGGSVLGDHGPATSAELAYPSGVAVTPTGDLFIADTDQYRIRLVTVPPRNTALPVISGTPKQGDTLTTTTGTWKSPSLLTYRYYWQRCTSTGTACVAIAGATASSYTLTSADVGHKISILIWATDQEGLAASARGAAVGPVTS